MSNLAYKSSDFHTAFTENTEFFPFFVILKEKNSVSSVNSV